MDRRRALRTTSTPSGRVTRSGGTTRTVGAARPPGPAPSRACGHAPDRPCGAPGPDSGVSSSNFLLSTGSGRRSCRSGPVQRCCPHDRPQAGTGPVHSDTPADPHLVPSTVHRVGRVAVDDRRTAPLASRSTEPPVLRDRSQGEGDQSRSPGAPWFRRVVPQGGSAGWFRRVVDVRRTAVGGPVRPRRGPASGARAWRRPTPYPSSPGAGRRPSRGRARDPRRRGPGR